MNDKKHPIVANISKVLKFALVKKFKYFEPHDHIDCGPTCLRMVANYFGLSLSSAYLQKVCEITRQGVSLKSLALGGERIGLKCIVAEVSFRYLYENKEKLPCILFWDNNHFVVLYRISNSLFSGRPRFHLADPGRGKVILSEDTMRSFFLNSETRGFALFFEPTELFSSFKKKVSDLDAKKESIFSFLQRYFRPYRAYYSQIGVSILIAAVVALFIPYLTQSIIDYGVANKEISFILLILAAQITLFIASTLTEIIRSHLLVHIGARINLSVLSDFLAKLISLPLKFYDSKLPGDIIARISDHNRVESLISATSLTALMSFINLFIYIFVIADYNLNIFYIYILGSYLSIQWTLFFMRWRKSIDYQRFRDYGSLNDKNFEIVNGIAEIKLNNYEDVIRRDLEAININVFKNDVTNLKLEQYQNIGTEFINQVKNVVIIYLAAKAVLDNDITVGIMLTIIFIIGQLNIPIKQFISILNTYQSSKIGIDRMNEIFVEEDEEIHSQIIPDNNNRTVKEGISLKDVTFHFPGQESNLFENLNLFIPKGKTTAIVGVSGSGKTTLLKLILNFYFPSSGSISINENDLSSVSPKWWRSKCGTVMQEGFLFSHSIGQNIVLNQEYDLERLITSVETANIDDFIAELPLNFDTKIGQTGVNLSTGQKQRLFIARAVYKNPDFLFFDEATSSLDSKNERVIMQNLSSRLKGKTLIIVAHRLSTVKNADQIVVLDKGRICEVGTHRQLVNLKGHYFELVRNQLDLDGE